MHRRSISLLLCLAACAAACGLGGGAPSSGGGSWVPGEPMTPGEEAMALEVVDRVNQERQALGLGALTWDATLAQIGRDHGGDMRDRGFFSHVDPDGNGPEDRLANAGIFPSAWGENIARGQPTPEAVMDSWMASDGHRDNILNGVFTRLGVGVVDAPGGPWWVQVFVTP